MDKFEKREALKRTVLAAVIPEVKAKMATYNRENINDTECYARLREQFPDIPSSVILDAIDEVRSELEDAWWDALEESVEVELVRSAMSRMTKPK